MRPDWLRIKLSTGKNFNEIKGILRENKLHTVCEEALCPNIGECFGTADGDVFNTRRHLHTTMRILRREEGRPFGVDEGEPLRIAKAIKKMNLQYVVITSVTRDDLTDGGASVYAQTIQCIREYVKDCMVEVLIPNFGGSSASLEIVLNARPDILNHNIETVPAFIHKSGLWPIMNVLFELLKECKETVEDRNN